MGKTKCCCGCSLCIASLVAPISRLVFSSPDGLHPITFSADIQSAKPTDNTSLVYSPAIPSSANNVSCRWPPSGQSWIHDAGSSNKIVDAFDSGCCWAGLAVADNLSVSAGQQYNRREANDLHVVSNNVYTYTGACAVGIWDQGTLTVSEYRELQQSGFAKRFAFGVSLKACWQMSGYGTPQILLTAKVFYKDWATILEQYRYAKSDSHTGFASWWHASFPPPGATVCTLNSGSPGYGTTWRCGGPGFTFLPDTTAPTPTECLSCSPPTAPTQVWLTPANCTIETIERSIVISTNSECSILGTHVFASGLPVTNKYGFTQGCGGTSIIPCRWRWPTHDCPIEAGSIMPVSYDEINLLPGHVDFASVHARQTVTSSTPVYSVSGSPILMNWWTEPWIITIS